MECIQCWTRDQRGLVRDPEVFDRIERVSKDDSSVAESGLENRPSLLLCPLASNFGMVLSKLKKVAKDRNTWDFGQILDLWSVCMVEVFDEKEKQTHNQKRECDWRSKVDQLV